MNITDKNNQINFENIVGGMKFFINLHPSLKDVQTVSHGVIGNTSGFGPEEFRFEP